MAGRKDRPVTPGLLVTSDGETFRGLSVGAPGIRTGEAVFTTSMSGYQETLTDPSYAEQVIVFTSPHIGNYGATDLDAQAKTIFASGLVARRISRDHSNWRAQRSLTELFEAQGLVAISEVDTRRLTRYLRTKGAMPVAIGAEVDEAEIRTAAQGAPSMVGRDLASVVSTRRPYHAAAGSESALRVVAIDLGIKTDIVRQLNTHGLDVWVLPAGISAPEILEYEPDGVFLSNGPGDPEPLDHQVGTVRELLGTVPIFGVCLGHQVLGRALGAGTFKLHFGHHGANHPVRRIVDSRVEITSQNHGFAVDLWSIVDSEAPKRSGMPTPDLLPDVASTDFGEVRPTHQNLNDGTLEGLACLDVPAFSVQYHPEAAPGPHDSGYLFDRFVELMS